MRSFRISDIFLTIPIQHFFDATILSSIHLVEDIQRRTFVWHRQHDLHSAQVRAPADLVSHHSQEIQETHTWLRTTMYLEFLAQIVLSSSNCQVVLHLLSVLFAPDATACQSVICSSSLGSRRTSPALPSTLALFFSRSPALSWQLCLWVH